MDAILLHGSFDQSLSPHKSHIRNPMKSIIHQQFYSSFIHSSMGLLQTPPLFPYQHRQPPPQPPLLPLPPAHRHLSENKTKDHSRTSKKSIKSPTKSTPNKQEKKRPPKRSVSISSAIILRPDPSATPKNVAKVSSSSSSDSTRINIYGGEKYSSAVDDISEGSWVFTVSPPPSSLPLPTFCLRPKLGRDAAGADGGATGNLRRLLRLE